MATVRLGPHKSEPGRTVASRDELDVEENTLAVAHAALKRADASIDYARFNVTQCVITSPISGVVLQKYRGRRHHYKRATATEP